MQSHLGELIALVTAVCWTATSLAFQQATRREGSLSVNLLRLLIALILYSVVSKFMRGTFFPIDASQHVWVWMSVSGLVGFVFGDFFLFKSYEYVSARISMLMMSLSPPIAAFIGWFALGETMTIKAILAMAVTLLGIVIVVTEKKKLDEANPQTKNKLKFSYPLRGLLFAFGGAVGQASGLVISKYGMGDYNVFAATQIRVIAGSIGFTIIIFMMRRWTRVFSAVKNTKSMRFILIGAFFGPFIGVYLSLLSVKYTTVGIASTIMAIIPVMIIPPAILLYKEKVTLKETIGALITVGGVIMFFI